MVMVEMAYTGSGGLEELVDHTATAVETVMSTHGLRWSRRYPVTLREVLGLGLQQHVLGGRTRVQADRAYRVTLGLPQGGMRAWTAELSGRITAGCEGRSSSALAQDLQRCLVHELGPCLEPAAR